MSMSLCYSLEALYVLSRYDRGAVTRRPVAREDFLFKGGQFLSSLPVSRVF